MTNIVYESITKALSADRLGAYTFSSEDTPEDVFARYLWDVELFGSLYDSIHFLEITVRNSLHDAARKVFRYEEWYDLPRVLCSIEQEKLQEAKDRLTKARHPHTPGWVVATLNFGFWVNLLDRRYERPHLLWPRCLKETFPCAPRSCRTRDKLQKKLDKIRELRNHIFHHEVVCPDEKELKDQHISIYEVIGWINPTILDVVKAVDRFPQIFKQGEGRHVSLAKQLLATARVMK